MRRVATGLTVFVLVLVGACDQQSNPQGSPDVSTSASLAQLDDVRGALLSRRDLPKLSGVATTLSAEDVAGEAADPTLADQLGQDGFVGAVRRDLRGRSRDITGADSRVLVFSNAMGAQSFRDVVAADPDPFFGGPADVRALTVAGAEGVLIKPPMCACAGAQPIYVGLVSSGKNLFWLQITGPRASSGAVSRLLSRMVTEPQQ